MSEQIYRFEKGRIYIAKAVYPVYIEPEITRDFVQVLKIQCSQGYGVHYEKERPVFFFNNCPVKVIDFAILESEDKTTIVEKALLRIFINNDWSKNFVVWAFPVDMPRFVYKNN